MSDKLKDLRKPFDANQIGKLPKPTKAQTAEVKADFKNGIRCTVCGGWHHPKVVHLDYVGHAALTDRFLDIDPLWTWEPLSIGENGLPAFDGNGGLWIKLTICGHSRIGYGDPDGKTGGNAIKETIGDALRNAGMRFGAALDLWHKGDLHSAGDEAISIENKTNDKLVVMGKALQANFESVACIKEAIASGQLETAVEAFNEMTDEDKTALHVAPTKGGIWTIEEYKTFKSNEWSAARKSYHGEK